MAEFSKIEWTDHTFNPWTGCTNVSPGCDHCYAEAWSKRTGHVRWGNNPRKRTTEAYWRAPLKWADSAPLFETQYGRRQRVFCASLADVFDNQVEPEWRADLFSLVRATPQLDWLMLTKRPQNIAKMLPADWGSSGYANVWLGATAEDELRLAQRWKHLARVPAVVRFISYEPAIGPISIPTKPTTPDWIITGGESGPGARPLNPNWIRQVAREAASLGVALFHKQWGCYSNNPLVCEMGHSVEIARTIDDTGKGGSLLDDQTRKAFPSQRRPKELAVA